MIKLKKSERRQLRRIERLGKEFQALIETELSVKLYKALIRYSKTNSYVTPGDIVVWSGVREDKIRYNRYVVIGYAPAHVYRLGAMSVIATRKLSPNGHIIKNGRVRLFFVSKGNLKITGRLDQWPAWSSEDTLMGRNGLPADNKIGLSYGRRPTLKETIDVLTLFI